MPSRTERIEIERFKTIGESGFQYYVIKYRTDIINVGIGRTDRLKSKKISYLLGDGRDVEDIDANTFKIVSTNEIIRKV